MDAVDDLEPELLLTSSTSLRLCLDKPSVMLPTRAHIPIHQELDSNPMSVSQSLSYFPMIHFASQLVSSFNVAFLNYQPIITLLSSNGEAAHLQFLTIFMSIYTYLIAIKYLEQ